MSHPLTDPARGRGPGLFRPRGLRVLRGGETCWGVLRGPVLPLAGGAVVSEMAHQLEAAGEAVELLAMLDAAPPGATAGWDVEELELMA